MSDHTHAIGKSFATAERTEASDLLAAVEQAHRYIERFRVSGSDGCCWIDTSVDTEPDLGFENGAAGLAYFYLMRYKSTRHDADLRIAHQGFRYIGRHWRSQLRIANPTAKGYELNVNSGVGSIAVALLAYYEETQDADSRIALREIAEHLALSAERKDGDVSWTGLPYFALGDSGIALLLLRIAAALNEAQWRSLAVAAAKTIVKNQTPSVRGGKAWEIKPPDYPHSFPNFVIGTSGIGYAMAVFHACTGEEVFLASARAAADYLNAISVPLKEGALVPLTDDPADSIFYLGACHGAGGTSKVFYQLYRMTGDAGYKRTIEDMSKGLLGLGAPETQSSGYWNNTCICCGTAAILQFQLALFAEFGDRHYLDAAIRCAKVLLGEAEDVGNGAIAWPLAETRLEPDKLTLNKGYMHGSAGIAAALLQLYQTLDGTFRWRRLLDDPYPQRNGEQPFGGAYDAAAH